MQALIFCGGLGTRINKDKKKKVLKPLIKINNKEILLRIINIYKKNNIKDFILLGGYKFESLKKFSKKIKNLNVKVINTGIYTETAGRLLKVKDQIKGDKFLLTYGDSLANFNLKKTLKLKKKNNIVLTVYNYKLPYGVLNIKKDKINHIREKNFSIPINAGFYILDKKIFKYINSANESFEKNTIPKILKSKSIKINYDITDVWYPMDTLEDKKKLEKVLK
tara:strand:+ start:1428 stop:2093 length:666 start_codon:yes stop_codon:yes gene_type:complete